MPQIKKYSPIFLALLFHVTGVLGILFTPYKDWFVYSTPIVLLTMFLLLSNTQIILSKEYFIFFIISFVIGMATEIIGVNTGLLFGDYQYGQVLGPKIYGVPVLIGLNWFIIVFCSGSLLTQVFDILRTKLNVNIATWTFSIFVVLGGAAIATCFDIILEPVAVKLNFWSWENGHIPLLNYICWFIISAVLLGIKMRLKIIRVNTFATSLLIIQALFFLMLNLFL
ncbi:MAG: carotenoid biosynthesis protein [Chitinophagaceae bacterium]|nr:carotenoid biosynthesis protein [Chitinophagaceae bacterium]